MIKNHKGHWITAPVTAVIACLLASVAVEAYANTEEEAVVIADPLSLYTKERSLFVEAKDALASDDVARFDSLYKSLAKYPLHDYLAFERLQHDWNSGTPTSADIDALNNFDQRTGDSSLSRRLTRTLQNRLFATEQWERFLALSQSRLASSMDCKTLKARWELGTLKGFDEQSLALWVKPRKHPSACEGVLKSLEAAYTPPVPSIWDKIYNAMEANKLEFATAQLGYLASDDKKRVQDWVNARKDPESYLTSLGVRKDTLLNRRIVVDLVVHWSKEDVPAAMDYWLQIRDKFAFSDDWYYDTHRAIAMRSAYRRMPEAYDWLHTFEAREDDLELMEWRIRTALLAEDWRAVLLGISRLPEKEQEEDHWAYWDARALEILGKPDQARVIYANLAKMQTYHGFLSADRLGVDYSLRDEPIEPDAGVLSRLLTEPALVKAREFRFVNLSLESRREWNNWLSGRTPEELAAASVLAGKWMLYDRAIYTAGKTEHKRALSTRFPVLFRTEVARAAVEHGVEPAWIFGVMRRESAYIQDVRSGAGAIGLMQLMPNTAKYVAKLQGDSNWKGDLTDPSTNVPFGAYYLRHVMDKFDGHQVLATASYNAGPHRVDQWLQPKSMEADIWIDTIPYTETRRYVRAVLAYAAIYEYQLMGKAQPLRMKLKTVPAAPEV